MGGEGRVGASGGRRAGDRLRQQEQQLRRQRRQRATHLSATDTSTPAGVCGSWSLAWRGSTDSKMASATSALSRGGGGARGGWWRRRAGRRSKPTHPPALPLTPPSLTLWQALPLSVVAPHGSSQRRHFSHHRGCQVGFAQVGGLARSPRCGCERQVGGAGGGGGGGGCRSHVAQRASSPLILTLDLPAHPQTNPCGTHPLNQHTHLHTHPPSPTHPPTLQPCSLRQGAHQRLHPLALIQQRAQVLLKGGAAEAGPAGGQWGGGVWVGGWVGGRVGGRCELSGAGVGAHSSPHAPRAQQTHQRPRAAPPGPSTHTGSPHVLQGRAKVVCVEELGILKPCAQHRLVARLGVW